MGGSNSLTLSYTDIQNSSLGECFLQDNDSNKYLALNFQEKLIFIKSEQVDDVNDVTCYTDYVSIE